MSQSLAAEKPLFEAKFAPNTMGDGVPTSGSPFIDDLWAREKGGFPGVFRTQP